MTGNNRKAFLVLSDGMVFEGRAFGAEGESIGEVVFNTSITGYQEIITDPSYRGQIVVMTYPQIGNYGVNQEDVESERPQVQGFVVKEYLDFPSNWRSEKGLRDYLIENGIVAIEGIDTRALTSHLRDNGVQMGIISTVGSDPCTLLEKVRAHPGISSLDLVNEVTTGRAFKWSEGIWRWQTKAEEQKIRRTEEKNYPDRTSDLPHFRTISVVVYDFGVKRNILRHLFDTGFDITVVPATTPAEAVLDMNPDGILLSNGPGDPQAVGYAIPIIRRLIGKKPIMGICLGHQLLGLALGGDTYKLKFGHHGGNHPVMDLSTERVEITSQNHNYCVDMKSLGDQAVLTHKNLYDGTEEGMRHKDLPIMSLQYHPEAGPGPNDSSYIFRRFREMITGST